jgi:uncharacterized protein (TIGR00369 family)
MAIVAAMTEKSANTATATSRAASFEPLSETQAGFYRDHFPAVMGAFFPGVVGFHIEEVRQDYARMRLPFREQLNQPGGVMHGGAIATLLDTVVVPAVLSGYDEQRFLVTLDMQIRYLSAIREEDAVAEGWVTKRGRSIVFCDAEVRSGSGELAATATLTYRSTAPRP